MKCGQGVACSDDFVNYFLSYLQAAHVVGPASAVHLRLISNLIKRVRKSNILEYFVSNSLRR